MSHGTAAPAPGRAAGNGHPGRRDLPASRGLPSPGGVPDDRGHPGSAPPAVRVREGAQEVLALLGPLHASGQTIIMVTHAPGQRAARLRSAQILRAE
jgi:hypothetical protein